MKTLKLGSKGADVKVLQSKLNLVADGIFGKNTDSAVKAYQAKHGLTPDGIVGPHTWESLGYSQAGRLIDTIIVHCSATKEGIDYPTSRINASHKARNFSSYIAADGTKQYIGYHFIIHLDGTIEACRPISKIGCHASGYNANSIGICYIGGLDARDTNGRMAKDTRTPEQKAALIKLITELISQYPTINKIIGHRDTSPDLNGNGIIEPREYIKSCPCFNAIPEYKHLLNK